MFLFYNRAMSLRIILLAAALGGAIHHFYTRPIVPAAGVLAPHAPVQRPLTAAPAFTHLGHTLTPRAHFALTARVLSGERYKIDELATLVPRDLALGWSIMSDSAIIEQLKISQSGRFYFWQTQGDALRAQVPQIIASSANMHVIPANAQVKDVINSVRVGELIEIEGKLVDVARGDGWAIKTSLSREDTGPGACEIVYVESAAIVRRAPSQ
jgi:hypothetical protein